MKSQVLIAFTLFISITSCLRIVPIPNQLTKGKTTLEISYFSSISFEFQAPHVQVHSLKANDFRNFQSHKENDLRQFKEISDDITTQRIQHLKPTHPRNDLQSINLVVQVNLNNTSTKYTSYDNFKIDEAYEISINEKFTVVKFNCHGYVSFLRALETFLQILVHSYQKTHLAFDYLPLHIKDAPSFGHRGIMIDMSRHFLSLDSIKTTIRGLQVTKFNVLHLHLTDSESFSFEMKKYPGLSTYGSYSQSEIYTQNQLIELDAYAQKYGVILIPEIDSPAHTRSWSNAPELQDIDSCRDYPKSEWGSYCNEPPCGQLDVTLQKSRDVSEAVMVETSQLFSSEYLHLGGDEPNQKCWESKPSIAQWMKENNVTDYNDLQSYYRNFQTKALSKNNLNKKRIFWLASNNAGVKTDDEAIMQFWGDESEYSYMQKIKNPIILSTYTYLYLDCGLGSSLGSNSWCDPYKTWERIYSLNVTANGTIDRERILGSEACLWSETSHSDDFIQKIFPRTIALNINLWNPDNKLSQIELVKHLVAANNNLQQAGIPTGVVSSQYCEKNVEDCFFK